MFIAGTMEDNSLLGENISQVIPGKNGAPSAAPSGIPTTGFQPTGQVFRWDKDGVTSSGMLWYARPLPSWAPAWKPGLAEVCCVLSISAWRPEPALTGLNVSLTNLWPGHFCRTESVHNNLLSSNKWFSLKQTPSCLGSEFYHCRYLRVLHSSTGALHH